MTELHTTVTTAYVPGDELVVEDFHESDGDVVALVRDSGEAEDAVHRCLAMGARALRGDWTSRLPRGWVALAVGAAFTFSLGTSRSVRLTRRPGRWRPTRPQRSSRSTEHVSRS